MLEVKIEKILPVTEARDSFNKLVDEVEQSDELYVLTKNGKPAAVLVGVHHLEKLTGTSHEELMEAASEAETKPEEKEETTASASTSMEGGAAESQPAANPQESAGTEEQITSVTVSENAANESPIPSGPTEPTSSTMSDPFNSGAPSTAMPDSTAGDPLDFLNEPVDETPNTAATTPEPSTPTPSPTTPISTTPVVPPTTDPNTNNTSAPTQPQV